MSDDIQSWLDYKEQFAVKVYQKAWVPDPSRGKPDKDEDFIMRAPGPLVLKSEHDRLKAALHEICGESLELGIVQIAERALGLEASSSAKSPGIQVNHDSRG